jgi:hypothetical protein
MTWLFRVWLSNAPEDELLDWSNRLFEAGCDDSTPGSFEGRAHVDFHRDAETLNGAIRSAIAEIQKAGLHVESVEITEQEMAEWPA